MDLAGECDTQSGLCVVKVRVDVLHLMYAVPSPTVSESQGRALLAAGVTLFRMLSGSRRRSPSYASIEINANFNLTSTNFNHGKFLRQQGPRRSSGSSSRQRSIVIENPS